MRKPMLLRLGLLAALLAVSFFIWRWSNLSHHVDVEAFEKITPSDDEEAVINLLGGPPSQALSSNCKRWTAARRHITVHFDDDGRVEQAYYLEETLRDTISRWWSALVGAEEPEFSIEAWDASRVRMFAPASGKVTLSRS